MSFTCEPSWTRTAEKSAPKAPPIFACSSRGRLRPDPAGAGGARSPSPPADDLRCTGALSGGEMSIVNVRLPGVPSGLEDRPGTRGSEDLRNASKLTFHLPISILAEDAGVLSSK